MGPLQRKPQAHLFELFHQERGGQSHCRCGTPTQGCGHLSSRLDRGCKLKGSHSPAGRPQWPRLSLRILGARGPASGLGHFPAAALVGLKLTLHLPGHIAAGTLLPGQALVSDSVMRSAILVAPGCAGCTACQHGRSGLVDSCCILAQLHQIQCFAPPCVVQPAADWPICVMQGKGLIDAALDCARCSLHADKHSSRWWEHPAC